MENSNIFERCFLPFFKKIELLQLYQKKIERLFIIVLTIELSSMVSKLMTVTWKRTSVAFPGREEDWNLKHWRYLHIEERTMSKNPGRVNYL